MKKIAFFFSILLLMGSLATMAQTRVITGTVTSAEDGQPIPGVSIVVQGTTLGTITNIDGKYTLQIPQGSNILVFSFIGMARQEVEIEGLSIIDVVLESQTIGVDEVMVVAYGTSRKESFTGSAEVISNEKLEKRSVANISKAFDGLAPGIQTTSGSGQPGSGSSVVIRGFGSINASNSPLYVVDGIPYDGNISAINPNDIESITILKDASAGALYGARGANGVIMVTTKKGETGETKYSIKATWGIASRAIPRYETMDEAAYLETIFQSYKNHEILNNGISPDLAGMAALQAMGTGSRRILGENQKYNPYNFPITELIDPVTGKVRSDATLRYDDDWLDEVTAKNPLRQEYIFTGSGSKDETTYLFSLGYLNEEGLLETTSFERFTGRVNVSTVGSDWFEAGLSTNFALNTSNTSQTGASAYSNVFYSAQLMAPIFPVYERNPDGTIITDASGKPVFDYGQSRPTGASSNFNSVATLYEDKYGTKNDNLSGRTFVSFGDTETGILQGLKLSLNFGFDYVNTNQMTYWNPNFGNAANTNGYLNKANGRTQSYTFNQLLTWNRSFGKHSFDLLGGHEFYSFTYNYLSATKTGFPFGGLYELDAATSITGASSYEDIYTIESYLSRANYDYDDKYYFSASYRTDGSSRFHEDFRWGQFWSVGGNWRLSEEDFMSDISWLDNLSFKASYGVQGNDDLRDDDNVSILYAWQSFYDLGWPNANMSGAAVSSLENTNLKWELNKNFNTGFEMQLYNRFSVSLEWYQRITENMLMEYPIASSLGFDSYLKNIGSMRNRGFDFSLGGNIIMGNDFRWNLTLMGATVKNKVLQLADKPEIITGSYIIREGEELYSFYVAEAAGVDPATGSKIYRVYDEDEEGNREYYLSTDIQQATASKSIMGSRIPDIYGSITNIFTYKGFDVNVLATYSLGGQILDGNYNNFMYGWYVGQASHVDRGRAWKEPGDITDIPRLEIGNNYPITNESLINASYLAVKNVTIGYTLPSRLSESLDLESIRFTATGENLLLFTHLKGMDPQYNFSGGTSFSYTPARTISFGVDVKF